VRATPDRSQAPSGALPSLDIVDVLDRMQGEPIDGDPTWYEIASDNLTGSVSAVFVECTTAEAPTATDGFLLPFACGRRVSVTQGNNSTLSHTGRSTYAFDFGAALDAPPLAMESGVVSHMRTNVDPGDPCDSNGGRDCINTANSVTIDHGDGTNTIYAHLNEARVEVGELVARGDVITLPGGAGWSTGPHTHVRRQDDCGGSYCQAITLDFADGDHTSDAGDTVTSGNCP